MRTLNCKRMARMISLYVAGDLVGAPEREVAAHLAACEGCRRLAEEFSENSSLLTRACTPPEFGAEFYSGIRRAVLGEIRRDRMLSKPSRFRRPWLYATSFAAIVIAAGVMLQHFGGTERETPQGLALAPQVNGQPTSGQAKGTNSSLSPQLSEVPQSPRESHGLPGTLRAQSHKVLALVNPRGSSRQFETVRKPDASDTAQIAQAMRSSSVEPGALEPVPMAGGTLSPSGRAPASQVSRIEIQTADPNIRIIWLAPRDSREREENNHD
ncbi:MAG TPA: zf-HC2 domain-containing protein [Pyrinomonadaceae bacterium]|nr:zf-HC2 domain-containing protein [Pyrinomonadaceae bacterium]